MKLILEDRADEYKTDTQRTDEYKTNSLQAVHCQLGPCDVRHAQCSEYIQRVQSYEMNTHVQAGYSSTWFCRKNPFFQDDAF